MLKMQAVAVKAQAPGTRRQERLTGQLGRPAAADEPANETFHNAGTFRLYLFLT